MELKNKKTGVVAEYGDDNARILLASGKFEKVQKEKAGKKEK